MSRRVIIDTSVLVRILLGDHPLVSPAAHAWFDRSVRRSDPEIVVLPTVVIEAVAVLRSTEYRRTQADMVVALEDILALPVHVEDRAVVAAAVELLRDRPSRDWEDCLIAAYAMAIADGHLATYDQKLLDPRPRAVPALSLGPLVTALVADHVPPSTHAATVTVSTTEPHARTVPSVTLA